MTHTRAQALRHTFLHIVRESTGEEGGGGGGGGRRERDSLVGKQRGVKSTTSRNRGRDVRGVGGGRPRKSAQRERGCQQRRAWHSLGSKQDAERRTGASQRGRDFAVAAGVSEKGDWVPTWVEEGRFLTLHITTTRITKPQQQHTHTHRGASIPGRMRVLTCV